MARQARLRDAYAEACASVPEDLLSQHLHHVMPSPAELWAVQRRIASQLGLHALMCYALKLRASHPSAIIFRVDQAALEYSQCATRPHRSESHHAWPCSSFAL